MLLSLGLTVTLTAPAEADNGRKQHLQHSKASLSSTLHAANADLDEVSSQLVQASRALTTAQAKLASAQSTLADTRGQLAVARSVDETMQAKLTGAESRLSAAQDAVDSTTDQIKGMTRDLSTFVVNSYQYGDPGLVSLGIVLDGGSPNQLGENMALADSVAGASTSSIDDLSATQVLLQVKQRQVRQLRDEVAVQRQAAADNLLRKQQLTTQAHQQTSAVRALVQTRRAAQQQAEQAKRVELRRIHRLQASRDKVKTMLRQLARHQPGAHVIANSGGFLSWPVANTYVTSPYGMRMHPILHIWELHDGTDFHADCGTPVYAAADGRIVSTYYDPAYGNRVIMSNGTVNGIALATSYNHLTRDVVSVGQNVKRGQLIATSGTTGYSTGCHVHFMVYVNGATVDPMTWLR